MNRDRLLGMITGILLAVVTLPLINNLTLAQEKNKTTAEIIAAEKDKYATDWAAKTSNEVKTEIDKLKGSVEQKIAASQIYVEKWSVEEHDRQLSVLQTVLGVSSEAAEAMITAQKVKFDGDGNPTFVTVEVGQ